MKLHNNGRGKLAPRGAWKAGGPMHTMKTLEIWTDGEAVTVSSTVTGLGVAEELCEESVNRFGIEDTVFV